MNIVKVGSIINLMTKRDPNAQVTNETLDKALVDVVDTLLAGMDNMLAEQKKHFASKDDLMEVKKELKNEIGWLKDDIKGLKSDLSKTPSRTEFDLLKSSAGKNLSS